MGDLSFSRCQCEWMLTTWTRFLSPHSSHPHLFLILGTPFSRIEFRDGRLLDEDLIFNT